MSRSSSTLDKLRSATTREDLAKLLRYRLRGFTGIVYGTPPALRYSDFFIPKKGGGTRKISAPNEKLSVLQRRLADLLQACLEESRNSIQPVKRSPSHGYELNKSIATNAGSHCKRRWVLNVDLKDFFPSIHFGRIQGILSKDKTLGLDPLIAETIAHVACHNGTLPQGSPCSPVLSNLVSRVLDGRLSRLAKRNHCVYTRYVDDLTFSTNAKQFPKRLALAFEGHRWEVGRELRKEIRSSGFEINDAKVRMLYRDSRQDVTGLTANRIVGAKQSYRHATRAMVHRLTETGGFEIPQLQSNGEITMAAGAVQQLRGRLSFISSIDRYNDVPYGQHDDNENHSRDKLFRKFILYADFYATSLPIIVCEGVTDPVYLTHAILERRAQFPEFVEDKGKGKASLRVRILRYSRKARAKSGYEPALTASLVGLKHPSANALRDFIQRYAEAAKQFAGKPSENPVIILVDNDQAGRDVATSIKKIKEIPPGCPWAHVVANLYLVFVPKKEGASDTIIEDLFDATVLAKTVDGKTFNSDKKADNKLHFGKTVFAHKVVRPNASTTNFSGFDPLLKCLSDVVKTAAAAAKPTVAL